MVLRVAAAPTTPTTPSSTSPPQQSRLREDFINGSENLLTAISDVFPECDATRHALALFQTLVKGEDSTEDAFLRKCHSIFRTHAAEIEARNPAAIFALSESMQVIKGIDLRAKWDDDGFTKDSKESLWAHLLKLQSSASLYTCVPLGTMNKIEALASQIGERISDEGQLDLKNVDLVAFGTEVMASMSQEELGELESKLPEICKCIGNAAGLLGGGGGSAATGGLDCTDLLRKMAMAFGGGEASGSSFPSSLDLAELLKTLGGGKMDPATLLSVARHLATALPTAAMTQQRPAIENAAAARRPALEVGDVAAANPSTKKRRKSGEAERQQ